MSTSAVTLRESLSYVCVLLRELGLSDLTAEAFRPNEAPAHRGSRLLKALHNLLVLSLAKFPNNSEILLQQYWQQIASEHVCSDIPEIGLQFIHSQLAEKKYPRLTLLAVSDFIGRELLLAFGWLLAHTHGLHHALNRRLLKYHLTASLPPYSQDGLQSIAAEHSAAHCSVLAGQHLQQVLQLCNAQQGWHQVQIAAHHALMLQSKCKAKARSLQALHHSRCTLLHNLTQLQYDVRSQQQPARSRSSNINPYEWSLLQNGDKLRQHEASLAAAACIAADCRQAEHHAAVFFEWLSSQHQQQAPVEAAAQQGSKTTWLTHHVSVAALPQLQAIAPCLQTKLHAAIQPFTENPPDCVHEKVAPSAFADEPAGPLLGQLQDEIACTVDPASFNSGASTLAVPCDIQQSIDAVTMKQKAANLPWRGFQLDPAVVVHSQMVSQDHVATSGISCDASAETSRLTEALVYTAKIMAKTRASHRHQLCHVTAPLHSNGIVMHL